MVKKQFIDKKNSQKFHLLHRSQRDSAYGSDEMPSDMVLVPAENLNDRKKYTPTSEFFTNSFPGDLDEENVHTLFCGGNHINELGLPNDGYDYSKHMKDAGDGTFISASGTFGANPFAMGKNIELPEELFPGEGPELDGNLNTITIDPSKTLTLSLFDLLFLSHISTLSFYSLISSTFF